MTSKLRLQPSILTGLSLSALPVAVSGYVFSNCMAFQDSDEHWRYVYSLAGFIVFLFMFLLVVATAGYYYISLKKKQ